MSALDDHLTEALRRRRAQWDQWERDRTAHVAELTAAREHPALDIPADTTHTLDALRQSFAPDAPADDVSPE